MKKKYEQSTGVRAIPAESHWILRTEASHLCDVSTTERPVLIMSRIKFQRNLRAFGSIPVVGSSWKSPQNKDADPHDHLTFSSIVIRSEEKHHYDIKDSVPGAFGPSDWQNNHLTEFKWTESTFANTNRVKNLHTDYSPMNSVLGLYRFCV